MSDVSFYNVCSSFLPRSQFGPGIPFTSSFPTIFDGEFVPGFPLQADQSVAPQTAPSPDALPRDTSTSGTSPTAMT